MKELCRPIFFVHGHVKEEIDHIDGPATNTTIHGAITAGMLVEGMERRVVRIVYTQALILSPWSVY